MRIAIVERYGHRSDVEYLVEVLGKDHELRVYGNPIVGHRISDDLFAGGPDAVDPHGFDVVIVVTLTVDPRPWLQLAKSRVPLIALIHNANWHFASKLERVDIGIAMLLRQWGWRMRSFTAERRGVLDHFAGLVFPSVDIAADHHDRVRVPCLGLPWALPHSDQQSSSAPGLAHYIIAGRVDERFRDYGPVVEALHLLGSSSIMRLELLGAPSHPRDKGVLSSFAERLPESVELITHDRYVSPDEYDAALRGCTAIINPHRGRVPYAGYAEYGGRTKISGSENDQIRSRRPALTDARYRGMSCLASCQRSYRNGQELAAEIVALGAAPADCEMPVEVEIDWQRMQWSAFLTEVIDGNS